MALESIVFPFDREFKSFEKKVGETAALRAEVEMIRSLLMEDGKRDAIKKAERDMYKRLGNE
jgi:hypothetical protein